MSEKLINCKACGQEVAKSAKKCPHCGAKNKNSAPILLSIIVGIVLIAIIASAGNDEPKKLETFPHPQQATPKQKRL